MSDTRTGAAPSLRQRREQILREFTRDMAELVQERAERSRLRPAARYPMDDLRTEGARMIVLGWIHAHDRAEEPTRARHVRQAMFLTAGLIAHCPQARTLQERWHAHARTTQNPDQATPPGLRLDMGLALAELKRRTDQEKGRKRDTSWKSDSPFHRRLVHLSRSEPEDLHLPLFRTLGYLNSQNAHLPAWWQLAADLVQHRYEPGKVALAWQESFLRTPEWRRTNR